MQNENANPPTPATEADVLRAAWETLTPREVDVALRIAEGAINHDIATALGVSVKTYDTHRGHILSKLGARHNVDVCRFATQLGYIELARFPETGN